MMFLLYRTIDGRSISIGSVLTDPMLAEFTVKPMSEEETAGVFAGRLMWDAPTLTFIQNPNWTPTEAGES